MQTAKIWFDNLSTTNLFLRYRPDLLQYFSFFGHHSDHKKSLITNALRDCLPRDPMPHGFKVTQVIPRIKDRGVLVEFTFKSEAKGNTDNSAVALADILKMIRSHLNTGDSVTDAPKFFTYDRIRAFLVKGQPFLEDISSNLASSKVKIEIWGGELNSVEPLFEQLRPFGRIFDLTLFKDAKVPYAVATFRSAWSASSAKICLHDAVLKNSTLKFSYEPRLKTNALLKFISDHPRIFVPLGATGLLALSYTVFDPMRVFFVKMKMNWFQIEWPSYLTFNSDATTRFKKWIKFNSWWKVEDEDGPLSVFAGRHKLEEKLTSWLNDRPATFMLVLGPRGFGKHSLVYNLVQDRKYRLNINCEEIANAADVEFGSILARQIGCTPTFRSFRWFANAADTALTASTGQKGIFSSPVEFELRKILRLATIAISDIVAKQKKAGDIVDYPVIFISDFMSADAQTPAGAEFGTGEAKRRFYEELSAWAAFLSQNELAHVIFVSNSGNNPSGQSHEGGSVSKMLSKFMDRSFETIVFSDASKPEAIKFVNDRIDGSLTPEQEKLLIENLGGRLDDLDSFVLKLKNGQSFKDAMDDLLLRAVSEIIRQTHSINHSYSARQYWYVVKILGLKSEISYITAKYSAEFGGNEEPIHALARQNIITIIYDITGNPKKIVPSKPLYGAAMKKILTSGFYYFMEIASLRDQLKDEEVQVIKCESELKDLASFIQAEPKSMFGGNDAVSKRFKFISNKLLKSQEKIEKLNKDLEECQALAEKMY